MALALVAAVFAITLPFGAWRVTTRRYSLPWFLAIHLPIPLIFLLRMEAGYSNAFIPFTVTACVAGQLVGGRLGTLLRRRRRGQRMQPVASPRDTTHGAMPPADVSVTSAAFTLGDGRGVRHDRSGPVDASG